MDYAPPVNGDPGDPDRSYIDGDPATGQEGSIPPAAAIEHPMREILAVIDAAGIARDAADLTQLRQAIDALAGVRVGALRPFATSLETDAGAAADRVVTPAALGVAARTHAGLGYQRLPGGLMINWGNVPTIAVGGFVGVAYAMSFTSQTFAVVVSADTSSSSSPITLSTQAAGSGASSIIIRNNGATPVGGFFVAIGV